MKLSRREFIKAGGTGSGALVIGLTLPGCSRSGGPRITEDGSWTPNAWLVLDGSGDVTFTLDRVEMGQGTYTGLTTLVAEELDVHPESVRIIFAPVGDAYANPEYILQVTGGSTSLATSWERLRKAGAGARALLVKAAAEVWQVEPGDIRTDEGALYHPDGTQTMAYSDVVELAARQRMPDEIPLKLPENFRYIGRHDKRLDAYAKVTGRAVYGLDVERPDMVYAVVSRPPRVGAKVDAVDDSAALAQKGVVDVFTIERGVAVVADSYWHARKAQEKLRIEWDERDAFRGDHESIFQDYRKAADDSRGDTERSNGNARSVLRRADRVFTAEYEAPFLAHATMEPQNCTAEVTARGLEIWAPTQAPDIARIAAARVTAFSPGDIEVHTTFLGGGFGRRLTQEYVEEAAAIAEKLDRPVKLIWSREEDIRHDMYRPGMLHRFQASLNGEGIEAWDHQITGPLIFDYFARNAAATQYPWVPRFLYDTMARVGRLTEGTFLTPKDHSAIEGAVEVPYGAPNILVRHTQADAGVPISYWRAVGHSHNGFAVETFMDELAHEAGVDPVEFRLRHLTDKPRHRAVLEKVAEAADWKGSMNEDHARGVAVHWSFGSYVAQIVEASIENQRILVHRVSCAIDCGQIVNPDIVRMQMESGINFGLSAALHGRIDWDEGRVRQSNFHDYRLLQQDESPAMDIVLVDSEEDPSGVGEPGLPPVIPALGNALFALTGKRQRSTPFVADPGETS